MSMTIVLGFINGMGGWALKVKLESIKLYYGWISPAALFDTSAAQSFQLWSNFGSPSVKFSQNCDHVQPMQLWIDDLINISALFLFSGMFLCKSLKPARILTLIKLEDCSSQQSVLGFTRSQRKGWRRFNLEVKWSPWLWWWWWQWCRSDLKKRPMKRMLKK